MTELSPIFTFPGHFLIKLHFHLCQAASWHLRSHVPRLSGGPGSDKLTGIDPLADSSYVQGMLSSPYLLLIVHIRTKGKLNNSTRGRMLWEQNVLCVHSALRGGGQEASQASTDVTVHGGMVINSLCIWGVCLKVVSASPQEIPIAVIIKYYVVLNMGHMFEK